LHLVDLNILKLIIQINCHYSFENRALEVWGSQEALIRERIKKAEEVKRYQQCNPSTINGNFYLCKVITNIHLISCRYFWCEASFERLPKRERRMVSTRRSDARIRKSCFDCHWNVNFSHACIHNLFSNDNFLLKKWSQFSV